jgi:hypothetical protein
VFLTEPKGLADPVILQQRREMLLTAPNVQPLREWAAELAARRGVTVPDFDPAEAGIEARVLFLHEVAPGPVIDRGKSTERPASGFNSIDNDDPSTANMWALREEAGLGETEVAHWSVVPWLLEPAGRKPNAQEIAMAAREMVGLLPHFKRLEVVVPCGVVAQKAWKDHSASRFPQLSTVPAWQPSALVMKQPAKREEMLQALRRVRGLIGPSTNS